SCHRRLCLLVRSEMGYGFNLHSERSRPGQYIRALDPGSPADRAGLKPQDRLIEVRQESFSLSLEQFSIIFLSCYHTHVHQYTDIHPHFLNSLVHSHSHTDHPSYSDSITNGSSSPHVNGTSSRSTYSDGSSQDTNTQSSSHLLDPFEEIGLCLSPTAAEAKEKAHAKRTRKRAPQMDWNKKHEIFSNF
uniref:PDZ domain-containing protein n=1 Tax=Sinocyclocheilus grahami TaxID=75366 RepID=A0A672PR25_SINGR